MQVTTHYCVYTIRVQVVVNEDTAGNVTQLQAEIKKLRDIVDQLKGKHDQM